MNELSTKIYKLNYQFILDNYLDRRLWKKSWTLFEYDGIKVELHIWYIDVKNDFISLEVYAYYDDHHYSSTSYLYTLSDNFNVNTFKSSINSSILSIFKDIESGIIKESDLMKKAHEATRAQEEILEKIAEKYLDKNKVINKKIRKVYIDSYVYQNRKSFESQLMDEKEYTIKPHLFLAYIAYAQAEEKSNLRDAIIKKNLLDEESVDEKIDEFLKKISSEEYQEDMASTLEDITSEEE